MGRSKWLLPVLALAVIATGLIYSETGRQLLLPESYSPDARQALRKPLRLSTLNDKAFLELLIALRTFHYRAQLSDVAEYRDVFLDTPDWELQRQGYALRLREKSKTDDTSAFAVRFELLPQYLSSNENRYNKNEDLTEAAARELEAQEIHPLQALAPDSKIATRLREVLGAAKIEPASLIPRLVAQLSRERYLITDKGRDWFEMDRETWRFQLPSATDSLYENEDVVFDTKLPRDDSELIRRVKSLRELAEMVQGVHNQEELPFQRAIKRISGADAS